MFKTIRQSVTLKTTPHEVYEMLMDSRKHTEFTGRPASISQEVGGRFTAYGDFISGINLELVPDERIIQSWRGSDWPEGHYSTATFALEKAEGGTCLTFTQTGVPESDYDKINQGWGDAYWKKMEAMLGK